MLKSEARLLKLSDLIAHVDGNEIDLPNVQRGFVWKPYQIEDFWDSLLRRFPTGSIITDVSRDKILLLDGQQRTTSIALGFANVNHIGVGGDKDCNILSSSTKYIRIFIDMKKPSGDDERKYFFRVITGSHPWGYRRNDNTKPLEANHKRKAMELWGKEDPFVENILHNVYPYDATAPLPLNIFTNAVKNEYELPKLQEELLAWVQRFCPDAAPDSITTWLERYKNKPANSIEANRSYTIEEIYDDMKKMWNEYKISMLPLPLVQINTPSVSASDDDLSDEDGNDDENNVNEIDVDDCGENEIDDESGENESGDEDAEIGVEDESSEDENEDENKEKNDCIEAVFVRLNSKGTPLSGEELNYSLLKSKIERDFQKSIEDACDGIMKPARFISLAYRLFEQDNSDADSITVNLRVRPKYFQSDMQDSKTLEKFTFFLKKVLNKNLLPKIKEVLKYGETSMRGYNTYLVDADYRLPYPLFIKIAAASYGEIMFVLMYRLFKHEDEFEYGSDLHRRMVAIILLFMWHGKDSRSKRYDKLIGKIWEHVKNATKEAMWGKSLIDIATKAGVGEREAPLKTIPHPRHNILECFGEPRKNKYCNWKAKINASMFRDFIYNIMCNRDLLLWIQRGFLSDQNLFPEKLFRLDDTDMPFDWDHILPESYIKNVSGVPHMLRRIYATPANFRAWPYKLNRSDQNDPPSVKLVGADKHETDIFGKQSFCDKEWRELPAYEGNHKRKFVNKYFPNMYNCMLNRWEKMYKEFMKVLDIRSLIK